MSKWRSIVVVLLASCTVTFGRMEMLPHYLAFPVLVKFEGGGDASAFYYSTSNGFYLITAKHVVFDPANGNLRGQEMTLESYDAKIAEAPNKLVKKVHLGAVQRDGLIFAHKTQDIAVLRLGESKSTTNGQSYVVYSSVYMEDVEGKASLVPVTEANTTPYGKVLISNDAYIFGYPSSIGLKAMPQIDYELPLLRRGVVAGKNVKARTIIIDCPSYYGNSGGPVCQTEPKEDLSIEYRIIGIVSEYIPFVETWENKTHRYVNMELSNSGYTVVVPIDLAIDLIGTAEQRAPGAEQGQTTR